MRGRAEEGIGWGGGSEIGKREEGRREEGMEGKRREEEREEKLGSIKRREGGMRLIEQGGIEKCRKERWRVGRDGGRGRKKITINR